MNRQSLYVTCLIAIVACPAGADPPRYSAWSAPQNLGSLINTSSVDGCPYISKDGLSLFFATSRFSASGQLDIVVARRASAGSPWLEPISIGGAINRTDSDEICPTLSIDGHLLFFVSNRAGGCGDADIFVSRRRDKRDDTGWEAPVNLGCHPWGPNSPQADITPSLFEDDTGLRHLYLSSTRPAPADSGGGLSDIYMSMLQANGVFGAAVFVAGLNTTFNDMRPNIRQRDGLEIFFESNRPGTLGNLDLYSATRESASASWSAPANLGLLVNSSAVDARGSLSWDGTELYFMSSRAGGFGSQDVYVTRRAQVRGP